MTEQKYPKYKYSGIEWLGDIPEHWEVSKLKFLTNKIVDGAHFTPTYVEEGVPFLRITDLRNKKIDFNSVKFIPLEEHNELIKRCNPERGNILLSKNGTIGITKIVDWDWGFSIFISVCLIKVKPALNPHFFTLLFDSKAVEVQITESGQKTSITNLHLTKIRELHCIIPPLSEQTKIANYLEQKIEKINRFITKKKELIERLKEQKAAIINEAVTKGLDKTVVMKDSGVEWLGEISEHWEVRKLTGGCNFVRGNSSFKKDELLSNGKYVALQYEKTYKVDEVNEEFKFYVNEEFYKESQIVSYGNIIIVSTSETIKDLGHTVFYNRSDLGLLGGEQLILKPYSKIVYEKCLYYSSKIFAKELQKYATGVKVYRFSINDLKTIYITIPTIEEQKLIVTYIEAQTQRIDATIVSIERELELVEEYKVALISEAVTEKVFIE